MAVTDQLGIPDIDDVVDGLYTLHRYHLLESAVPETNPVTPVDIYMVQDLAADAPAPQVSREVFQQGGGNESVIDERRFRYSANMTFKAGEVHTLIQALLGVSYDTSNYVGLPLRFDPYPKLILETIKRKKDNTTHLWSQVYQDLIIMPFNFGSPMEDEEVSVPVRSQHDPFTIISGTEVVYDEFDGDGSTVAFTLSSTPLLVTDVSLNAKEDWVLENLIFCKVKASGAKTGTRQMSGITLVATALTFTTAPAASSVVQVAYVKETA